MNGLKKILKSKTTFDVQWAFWSLLSSAFMHFVLRVIIGKELGPDALGIYTIIFTIFLLGIQFANFGIGGAITKYIAEFSDDREKIQQYISSGVVGSIISGSLFGIVLFLFSPILANILFNIPEMEPLLMISALCFPFVAIQVSTLGAYNGMRKMNIFAFLSIPLNILIIIITVVFVLFCNLSLFGAVLGLVIPYCFAGILSLSLLYKDNWIAIAPFRFDLLKEMTIFGFFFVLATSSSVLNTYISTFLIGFFLTAGEVGIYSVASTISQILTVIPSAVQRIITPATAFTYAKNGKKEARKIFLESAKYSLIITVVLGIFLIVLAPWIISFLFSGEFLPAYEPLVILIIGNILFSPIISNGAFFFSIGKITVPYKVNLIYIAITIGLSIFFIPIFGVVGAAIATLSVQILSLMAYLLLVWKYTS